MSSQIDLLQQDLFTISRIILDENSSDTALRGALDDFANLCSRLSGIVPQATFEAWSGDTFLETGVAINPQAAAQCIKDYQRSVMFIRGVHAAIKHLLQQQRTLPVRILYAGCGPFATQLLPLLLQFDAAVLDVTLLDIHQESLDSVEQLIHRFALQDFSIHLIQGDAAHYRHNNCLDLILAETMQKSLEQEPQLAVTRNLSVQLADKGVFIPEEIEVKLCLGHFEKEKGWLHEGHKLDHLALCQQGERIELGSLIKLTAALGKELHREKELSGDCDEQALTKLTIEIPDVDQLQSFDALMLTHIQVYQAYRLGDYDSDISYPKKCEELPLLSNNEVYSAFYQLGQYPRFVLSKLT